MSVSISVVTVRLKARKLACDSGFGAFVYVIESRLQWALLSLNSRVSDTVTNHQAPEYLDSTWWGGKFGAMESFVQAKLGPSVNRIAGRFPWFCLWHEVTRFYSLAWLCCQYKKLSGARNVFEVPTSHSLCPMASDPGILALESGYDFRQILITQASPCYINAIC